MKFILATLVAGLLTTPGTGQQTPHDALFYRPAYETYNQFMLKITNNTCDTNLQDASEICDPFIDKIAQTNPKVLDIIQQLQHPCLQEMLTTSQLQQETIGCNKANVHKNYKKVCKHLELNIKNLNALLNNNRQL
jgi:hypothetical protein